MYVDKVLSGVRAVQTGKDFLMIEAQKFQQPVDVIFRLK